MPKISSRFRNRKINFKSNISIYVGSFDSPFDDDYAGNLSFGTEALAASESGHLPPGFTTNEAGETIRVETGVDKEEEGEHHLQAVISASAAALTRSRGSANGAGPLPKPLTAHIPTPDATGVVVNYTDYYRHNVYVDPHSYIRSSDTIEETMGIAYTMDEEDAEFLEEHNARVKEEGQPNVNGEPPYRPSSPSFNGSDSSQVARTDGSLVARNGHYPNDGPINGLKRAQPRKDKGKEAAMAPLAISEEDFELVMDLFERTTDRKTPTLHMDVSRIPCLEDLEVYFSTYVPQYLLKTVKIIARIVYPHWKGRRLKAGGKNIVPQLDFDETNETPYVCFRRREVKIARKTRRTDTQTLERLVHLKSDLSSAQELLLKVLERERCKRDSVVSETSIFDNRMRIRDVKRRLGENDGDESLLIARREKKRRREEIQQTPPGSNKIVIPNRSSLGPSSPCPPADPIPPYKDRTTNASQRVEKDMQRKREQELGWEDLTDSAFLPLPQALPSRYWRASEKLYLLGQDGRKPTEVIIFDHQHVPYIQNIGSRYRKRVGRGGRILLDRLAARSFKESSETDSDILLSLRERWKYDCDVPQELPSTRHPLVVDDFDTRFASARSCLVSTLDWEALYPNTVHIEEALRWTVKEPERLPPIQVVGKLPGQRGSFVGSSLNSNGSTPVPANIASQMLAVANRAQASVVAHQMRRNTSAGGTPPQIANSGALPPQPPQIRRLMWENGATA